MKRILVTGATGFVGGHLLNLLVKHMHEFEVHIIVNANSNKSYIKNDYITVHKFDLTQPHYIDLQFDDIIHLAAYNKTHLRKNDDFELYYSSNVKSVINIFKNLSFKRFIFLSTTNLYNSTNAVIDENDSVSYSSYYEKSKYLAELYCLENHPSKTLILRCANLCGPNQKPVAIVPHFINQAIQNEPLDIFVPKNREINLLDVRDVATLILKVIKYPITFGIYNVSSSKTIAIQTIANIIVNNTNSKSKIELNNQQLETIQHISSKKAEKRFDWLPTHIIEKTIEEMIKNKMEEIMDTEKVLNEIYAQANYLNRSYKISCSNLMNIAEKHSISHTKIGNLCNENNISISQCQFGCF